MKNEEINIKIYYYIDDETGEKVYDIETMKEEFEQALQELTITKKQ